MMKDKPHLEPIDQAERSAAPGDYVFRPKRRRFGGDRDERKGLLADVFREINEDRLREEHWPAADSGKARAVIYVRANNENGWSHAAQTTKSTKYCKARGYRIVEELEVIGRSIAGPEQRIKDLAAAGKIDVVVVNGLWLREETLQALTQANISFEDCMDWDLSRYVTAELAGEAETPDRHVSRQLNPPETPAETVNSNGANGVHSFQIVEPHPKGGQRPVHHGFFLTVDAAERYRQSRPDSSGLSIMLLIDRYPIRDLSADEIGARGVDPAEAKTIEEYVNRRTSSVADGTISL